jgi:hypothetical protein
MPEVDALLYRQEGAASYQEGASRSAFMIKCPPLSLRCYLTLDDDVSNTLRLLWECINSKVHAV